MKPTLLPWCLPLLLGACTSWPPGQPVTADTQPPEAGTIQQQGEDAFLIDKPGLRGGLRVGQLKEQALKQADQHCASLRKGLRVDEAIETSSQPPGYQLRFSCIAIAAPE